MNDIDLTARAQDAVGYTFHDHSLLITALTHSSIAGTRLESNERLEFLGDAVLGMVACEALYDRFPDWLEGDMTKVKSMVVSRRVCAEISDHLALTDMLILGNGINSSVRLPTSLRAAVFEAVIGAVYVDAGWEEARELVLDLLLDRISHGAERPGRQDYKTRLQELTAQLNLGSPTYRLSGTGPDHDKRFTAIALVDGEPRGEGSGTSKKRAEQAAARQAWSELTTSATAADAKGTGDGPL